MIEHAETAPDIRSFGCDLRLYVYCFCSGGGSRTREEQIQHTQISIRSFSCRFFQTPCQHSLSHRCICVLWTSSALLNILPSISAIISIFYEVLYLYCLLHIFSISMSVKHIIPVLLPVRTGQFSSETLTSYGEKPHTTNPTPDRTCCLSIQLSSKIAQIH